MMRLIDADWIVQKLEGWQDQLAERYGENDEYVLCLAEVLMKIDDAPTVDVPDRKVGKWEQKEDPYGFFDTIPVCSICGCTTKMRETYHYCPNCGARMKGEGMVDDD